MIGFGERGGTFSGLAALRRTASLRRVRGAVCVALAFVPRASSDLIPGDCPAAFSCPSFLPFVAMPKVQRARTKLHTPAVGGSAWSAAAAAPSAEEVRDRNAIAVLDEDVEGLDLVTALGETEEQKRAAVADALKDLIAMGSGSDDDDDDDEDEDEDDEEEGDDTMDDGRMPSKGQLQISGLGAGAASGAAKAASASGASKAASAAAAKPKLEFAPSAPVRKGASKADKRAAKHDKLLSRLALPGTLVAAVKAEKNARKHNTAAFRSLRALGEQLAAPLLTPREQRKLNMQQKAAAAGIGVATGGAGGSEGLFLGGEGDALKLKQLEQQVQQRQQVAQAAAPKKQTKVAPAGDASATAAASAAHTAAAASAPAAAAAPRQSQSASARARNTRAELAHFTAVLAHPRFQAAPLAALQTHLANSQALQKLQQQVDALEQPDVAAAQQQAAAAARRNVSGSTKKKNKKAAMHRQQVLQQNMADD